MFVPATATGATPAYVAPSSAAHIQTPPMVFKISPAAHVRKLTCVPAISTGVTAVYVVFASAEQLHAPPASFRTSPLLQPVVDSATETLLPVFVAVTPLASPTPATR